MAEIEVAPSAGFCFGVQRAVNQVERLTQTTPQGQLVTLGPLIHNPQEVQRLRRLGARAVEEKDGRPQEHVVIRSHGVPREEKRRLQARGPVSDATCPYVRSCQTLAARMAGKGYAVIVAGEAGHPETEAVLSYARAAGRGFVGVVESPDALRKLEVGGPRRVALLAQTTLPAETLGQMAAVCAERFVETRVLNTICGATARRQKEAEILARRSDVVIVVGGRNSANTRRLRETCAKVQPRTHQVEVAGELMRQWVAGARRVGVTAGASTGQETIQQVVQRLQELCD